MGTDRARVVRSTTLGDVYIATRKTAQARDNYQKAIGPAHETGNRQNQHEARFGLAVANLFLGNLVEAGEAIDAALKYDFPENNAAAWMMAGIIRLRQGEPTQRRSAFSRGLRESHGLLEKCIQNFSALETKALALCGLAICEDERHLAAATEALRAARKITGDTAKGVVTSLLNKFDALTLADSDDILAPARKAAE